MWQKKLRFVVQLRFCIYVIYKFSNYRDVVLTELQVILSAFVTY